MAKFALAVLLIAALVYALLYLLARRRARRASGPGSGGTRPGTRRQSAPDDDEDFLRWLDRKQRRERDRPDAADPDSEAG